MRYSRDMLYSEAGDNYINTSNLQDVLDFVQDVRDNLTDALRNAESGIETVDLQYEIDLFDGEMAAGMKELAGIIDATGADTTLVIDRVVDDYLDEMVQSCYDLPKDLPAFVTLTVDYDMLKQDYCDVEFDGYTYWYRSE